jgi:hypothetical protein
MPFLRKEGWPAQLTRMFQKPNGRAQDRTRPMSSKVPLVDITWLDSPILVDAGLRARLDAFRGKNAAIGWSWFVQTTRRLSKLDFESLIGK